MRRHDSRRRDSARGADHAAYTTVESNISFIREVRAGEWVVATGKMLNLGVAWPWRKRPWLARTGACWPMERPGSASSDCSPTIFRGCGTISHPPRPAIHNRV
ncbi:hotdog domain-containing protein [Sphingobium cyanobacteriorum]|uniref:hotdog domain-containing protein n=1 Tax=Sphingobium cyanobacteriorum TaxID=3063954 RepID=UPI003CC69B64